MRWQNNFQLIIYHEFSQHSSGISSIISVCNLYYYPQYLPPLSLGEIGVTITVRKGGHRRKRRVETGFNSKTQAQRSEGCAKILHGFQCGTKRPTHRAKLSFLLLCFHSPATAYTLAPVCRVVFIFLSFSIQFLHRFNLPFMTYSVDK